MIRLFVPCLLLVLAGCNGGSTTVELRESMRREIVTNIREGVLPFWMDYAVAPDGGFYGTVLRDGTPVPDTPRGGVLNARILWSFSAAYHAFGEADYKRLADYARRYFLDTFIDKRFGGVYWLVNPDGEVLNAFKYTYAMTYGIYGLAGHYLATGDEESLEAAVDLYRTLEEKGREPQHDGYVECFTQDWQPLDNYFNNAPKTMNAHLHVMEAYTLLYQCWKDDGLRQRLAFCVELFLDRLYDSSRKHFNLFFDNEWNSLEEMDSYAHDLEACWLLCEAANQLDDKELKARAGQLALEVTDACLSEGLNEKGYMGYENHDGKGKDHAAWWGQVEAIIACVNAWQMTGKDAYIEAASKVWSFVKESMVDTEYGEWFSDCFDGEPKKETPKVSVWRCPYHSVRLGVEMEKRLE